MAPGDFIETIQGKAAAPNMPEQTLRLMQVIDAIYASVKTGKPGVSLIKSVRTGVLHVRTGKNKRLARW